MKTAEDLRDTVTRLVAYCQRNEWAGRDPFDALNSRLFAHARFLHFRFPRLALTQAAKRSPINFRPLLLVPQSKNPKGLALSVRALLKLSTVGLADEQAALNLLEEIASLRSGGQDHWCWGYNFDWQSRGLFIPKGTPNIICTTFVGGALLDAFKHFGNARFLEMAVSAARLVCEKLFYTRPEGEACFSYTPLQKDAVHNANLLGAAFLCRVARESGEAQFAEPALRAARFTVSRQSPDGAWVYGERAYPSQGWIDNFHTGFNLCALRDIGRDAGTSEFDAAVARGLDFYLKHFFREDGAAKYYHNRVYPIDIHSVAQSLITLGTFSDVQPGNLELAKRVFRWARQNMWSRDGYFYYQKHPWYTNRISYMRWSQQWMLLGLAVLLECLTPTQASPVTGGNHGD